MSGRAEGPRSRRHHHGHWSVHARVERFAEPALLLLLRERPAHGYDLLERLPELTGEQRVEMGNLYRLLRALEEEGLVSSEWDALPPVPPSAATRSLPPARNSSSTGSRRCAAHRSARPSFSSDTRRGGEHARHHHHPGRGHGPRGLFRGGFPNRRELIERLENHQRDLEQQLADIADVLAHLRDRGDESQPQQG